MKYVQTIIVLLAAIGLTASCIKDDRDDCEFVSLYFRYLADGSRNVLPDYMDQVDLYVYDTSNTLVKQVTYSKAELTKYETPKFRLEPGRYRVVTIGNKYDRTQLQNYTSGTLDNMLFMSPQLGVREPIEGQDANYIGYKDIDVPAEVSFCDTVDIHCAHIDLDIYVYGLHYESDEAYSLLIEHAPAVTNFLNQVSDRQVDIKPVLGFNGNNTNYFYTKDLNVFRFGYDTPMIIKVLDWNGQVKGQMALKDFLAEYGDRLPNLNEREEITIPIYISFATLGVDLEIPKWGISEGTIEWGESE